MKILWTTIHVSDLDRSIAFYRDLIGMSVVERFPAGPNEIAMLGNGEDTKLELLCSGAAPEAPGAGVSIGIHPDDPEGVLNALRDAGKNLQAISPNPNLTFYMVPDPDGYMVQIVERY